MRARIRARASLHQVVEKSQRFEQSRWTARGTRMRRALRRKRVAQKADADGNRGRHFRAGLLDAGASAITETMTISGAVDDASSDHPGLKKPSGFSVRRRFAFGADRTGKHSSNHRCFFARGDHSKARSRSPLKIFS